MWGNRPSDWGFLRRAITRYPCLRIRHERWAPRKPVAPVIKTVGLFIFRCKIPEFGAKSEKNLSGMYLCVMKHIAIVNGPNLNLLGTREPEIYGGQSFDDYFQGLQARWLGVTLTAFQSNVEGEIINELQRLAKSGTCDGIVLNAAAYSHTSIAIADTLKAIETPVILVHISNVFARETERKTDLMAASARGVICGLGLSGYDLAVRALM